MIPLSGRHALPVLIAFCLLAIPIGYHGVLRPNVEDCARPKRLTEPDVLPLATRGNRRPAKAPDYVVDWHEGRLLIERPWRTEPLWRIARSYDLSRFYFLPPGLFANVFPEDEVLTLVRRVEGVDLPIHVRIDDSEGFRNFSAYIYVFGGRPVRHPFTASLAHAAQQLFSGTLPLTMILAGGGSSVEHAAGNEDVLIEWMESAWTRFGEVCGS